MTSPSKRWRTRLLLAVCGLLIALVGLEVFARIRLGNAFVQGAFAGPPQAICGEFDADFGWRNRANTSVRIALAGTTYDVTLNSRGQRGPERAREKPSGVLRVVLLGDSTAWGWGVDDEQMWPRLVEAKLGGQIEIINLSVPGYGTDQELWALEGAGLAYSPDLVLLAFVHNDTISNRFPSMQGMGKPFYKRDASGAFNLEGKPVPPPKADSDLAQRFLRRRLSMYCASTKLFEPPAPRPSRLKLEDPKVVADIERFWDDVTNPQGWSFMLLGRVHDAATTAHADMLAFVIPHLVDRYLYDPTTPVPAHEAGVAFETYGTKSLARAGRTLGFETFSVDQALLDVVSKGENLDCGDEHLNARGNEVIAEVIATRVKAWSATRKSK